MKTWWKKFRWKVFAIFVYFEVEQISLAIATNTYIDEILPLAHYLPLSIASVVDWVETDIDAVCGWSLDLEDLNIVPSILIANASESFVARPIVVESTYLALA